MRRWLKPSSLERMPTPLKHCCISYLQEISTMPELKGQSQAVEGLIASVVELEVGLHLEQGSEDPVGSTEKVNQLSQCLPDAVGLTMAEQVLPATEPVTGLQHLNFIRFSKASCFS